MTVVTLPRQDVYAPLLTLEDFATGLFNNWGIGDASRNDGILVLVMRADRAMRTELGRAMAMTGTMPSRAWSVWSFLPHFRNGDYQTGILNGSSAVIDSIALPFFASNPAPKPTNDSLPWYAVPIFGLFIALVMLRPGWAISSSACAPARNTGPGERCA